ncbi:MAG: hypothetical protein SPF28_03555 [Eubacteriales bacterium]|nr:hypothetical protein [Eubacteriales bacterium]
MTHNDNSVSATCLRRTSLHKQHRLPKGTHHCRRQQGNLVKMAEIRGGKVWFLSVFATKFGVFYNCHKLFWFRLRFLTLGKHNILWSEKFWKIFGIFRRKK